MSTAAATRKLSFVAALCALALALVGCGSSSSSLSKQQLAAKTNSICTRYGNKIKAIPQPADLIQNHVSAAHFFDQVSPLYDQALGEMRALKPADSVKQQWNDLLAKFGAIATLVHQIKQKADNADRRGITLLGQIQPLTTAANSAATEIGATACGSNA